MMEYRKETDTDWTAWTALQISGTSVRADIRGLEENTAYAVRLTNGADTSEELTFTTGIAEILPNLSFDDWYQEGKAWMPNASASSYVWDSANPGTAGLGIVPTTP